MGNNVSLKFNRLSGRVSIMVFSRMTFVPPKECEFALPSRERGEAADARRQWTCCQAIVALPMPVRRNEIQTRL